MERTCVVLALLGCASMRSASREDSPRQLQPGQIIVALAAEGEEELLEVREALAAEYHLVEAGTFPLGSVHLRCVVFQVGGEDRLAEVIERLNRDPRVALAQRNQVFRGLGEESAGPPLSYGAALIHADAAQRSRTGKGVRIAVIDTGVAADHPGLRGRVVQTRSFVSGGEATFGRDLHGTAVAGVIAAHRDGRAGLLGIAPGAEILALKACWYTADEGAKAVCSSWTLAKAVDFAVNAGAQVINLSLGGPPDELLRRLIVKAQEHGAIAVAAGAEGGDDPGFPASMPGVIAVVASDAQGQAAVPRWTARTFAMAAPGVDILTTVPSGGYDFLSGSSLAAAHVSGVVALLREGNPAFTSSQMLDLLRRTAHRLPVEGGMVASAGLVDACAALGSLMGDATCP
jgi:subtilisin family serine protease